jgi:mono/diheme cytochrome c family protein
MRRSGFLSIVITSLIVLASGSNPPAAQAQHPEQRGTAPQALKPGDTPAPLSEAAVARGRYIVENVSVCWRCHSPIDSTGARDHTRWLMGGQVAMRSTLAGAEWAIVAPRLAGRPPGTDEEFVHLLMTGISRRGTYLRPPMPQFRMYQEDAEAVLAYLKSLGGGHLMTAVH